MASIINSTTTAGVTVTGDNSGSLQLATNNGTTAVTIDTSQQVLVGTTTSTNNIRLNQKIAVTTAGSGNYGGVSNTSYNGTTASTGPIFDMQRSRGTTDGSMTAVASGDTLGYMVFRGSDGTSFQDASFITGQVDGTVGSGSVPGRLVFNTGAEAMRINSSGSLLVGATSAIASEKVNVTQSGQFTTIYANNTNATNAYGIRANLANYFFNQTSFLFDGIEFTNLRFRVYSDGGIANYSGNNVNLSDQREKKDIALAHNYLDKICQIPVKTFLYINQTDTQKTLGVIAQDVQAIAPELINETDWSADADGSKMRLSIYQTDLQFALMKAIQELKAELDATKAEVQALKGVA